MSAPLWFLIGMMVGGTLGLLITALMIAAGDNLEENDDA